MRSFKTLSARRITGSNDKFDLTLIVHTPGLPSVKIFMQEVTPEKGKTVLGMIEAAELEQDLRSG